ncbi:hypothetical protein [Actinoplanes sp. DH11]|uniref:hypothetical protein n=1 Tax=Actinoplanes sp. DH11 TaxID=2857011 RepID=UPI001E5ADBE1|nr:hypothetical protein [Actinoplanes sp. DH11]
MTTRTTPNTSLLVTLSVVAFVVAGGLLAALSADVFGEGSSGLVQSVMIGLFIGGAVLLVMTLLRRRR